MRMDSHLRPLFFLKNSLRMKKGLTISIPCLSRQKLFSSLPAKTKLKAILLLLEGSPSSVSSISLLWIRPHQPRGRPLLEGFAYFLPLGLGTGYNVIAFGLAVAICQRRSIFSSNNRRRTRMRMASAISASDPFREVSYRRGKGIDHNSPPTYLQGGNKPIFEKSCISIDIYLLTVTKKPHPIAGSGLYKIDLISINSSRNPGARKRHRQPCSLRFRWLEKSSPRRFSPRSIPRYSRLGENPRSVAKKEDW